MVAGGVGCDRQQVVQPQLVGENVIGVLALSRCTMFFVSYPVRLMRSLVVIVALNSHTRRTQVDDAHKYPPGRGFSDNYTTFPEYYSAL